MVYPKKMGVLEPLKKEKEQANLIRSEMKWGQTPAFYFLGCILFLERPNPSTQLTEIA